jgi:hypothetical protein
MRYQYNPLNPNGDEIRLLHLLPGERHDALRVHIEHCQFAKDQIPKFEALSYVCGDPKSVGSVDCNQASISITSNLAKALLHFRKKTSARVLWIDAICVNQRDLRERSQQVSLMAAIYSRAHRVTIWVGDEYDDSNLAMDCIEMIGSKVYADWEHGTLHNKTDDTHWADSKCESTLSSERWVALRKFFSRPWFDRLWVVQEARLGAERAVVECGDRLIHYEFLSNAALYIIKKHPLIEGPLPIGKPAVYPNGRGDLLELLSDTVDLKCQDPRDRVFALLSLCDHVGTSLQADYSKTVVQVYTEVAHHYRNQVDFLVYVVFPSTVEGLPSWVPNWNATNTAFRFRMQYASLLSASSVIYMTGTELCLRGKILGTVEDVCALGVSPPSCSEQIHSMMGALIGFASRNKLLKHLSDDGFLQTLCRVMWLNEYEDRYATSSTYRAKLTGWEHREALSAFKRALHCSQTRALDMLRRMIDRDSGRACFPWSELAKSCSGRNLLLLKNGALGLGPVSTVPGDRVSVLLGCDILMVLRDAQQNKYQTIGAAYVDGCMKGEGLVGPLPAHVDMLLHETREGLNQWRFRDRRSGDVSMEDPRLGSLPPDWALDEAEDEELRVFRNESTGERRNAYGDPRCDAEWLMQRGIQLEALTLV